MRWQFIAASNQTYSVEYRDDLVHGQWSNLLRLDAAATNRTVWVTNEPPAANLNRYYQVKTPWNP